MGATPGWYPDPSGGPNRYWDGFAWHDAVPVRPGPTPAKTGGSAWKPLLIICGAAIVLGGIVMAVGGNREPQRVADTGSQFTDAEARAGVIDTCQAAIRKALRDPDSAQFSEWKAWPESDSTGGGGKRYSADGLVNARNGFGGYSGAEMYSCTAVVAATGNVRADASPHRPPPTFRQPG